MPNILCYIVLLMLGLAVKAETRPIQVIEKSSYSKPVVGSNDVANDLDEQFSLLNDDCYSKKTVCDRQLNLANHHPTCAHSVKNGLINYFSLCEINVQICMFNRQKKNPDSNKKYNYSKLYFNDLLYPCDYYRNQTTTEKDATRFYYKLGAEYMFRNAGKSYLNV